jgi:hypothetical protein
LIGSMEFVAASGFPLKADLHDDGHWTSSSAVLAEYLNAFYSPVVYPSPGYGPLGTGQLAQAARDFKGTCSLARLYVPDTKRIY